LHTYVPSSISGTYVSSPAAVTVAARAARIQPGARARHTRTRPNTHARARAHTHAQTQIRARAHPHALTHTQVNTNSMATDAGVNVQGVDLSARCQSRGPTIAACRLS
jgi:hypothetical protein